MKLGNERGNTDANNALMIIVCLLLFVCVAFGAYSFLSHKQETSAPPSDEYQASSQPQEITERGELTESTEPAEVAELQAEPEKEEPAEPTAASQIQKDTEPAEIESLLKKAQDYARRAENEYQIAEAGSRGNMEEKAYGTPPAVYLILKAIYTQNEAMLLRKKEE